MEIYILLLLLLLLIVVDVIYLYVSVPHRSLAGNPYSEAPET
jgi:hypothetical protein